MLLQLLPIKTRALLPPKDNIYPVLDKYLPKLKEGDVLFIASKVLAIHQGRTIRKSENRINQKPEIIKREADFSLPMHKVGNSEIVLTIKNHTLIPSAGIDESNGNGYYILWPKNTNRLCKDICNFLKKKYKLKKLAVIAVDSHTTPLRWGTQGISIGFFGLEPLKDYRGAKDIFGRKLKYTQSNIVDSLANLGVMVMGEGKEQTPIVIIRGLSSPLSLRERTGLPAIALAKVGVRVKFTNKNLHRKLIIDPKKDLYYPLLKIFSARGGSAPCGKKL